MLPLCLKASFLLMVSWLGSQGAWAEPNPSESTRFATAEPRYRLSLTDKEWSFFQRAAAQAVQRYGGDIDFAMHLQRGPEVGSNLWTADLTGQRAMNAWAFWQAEQTAEVLGRVDLAQLDAQSIDLLRQTQTLNAKIAQAKANPVWDRVSVDATVVLDKTGSLGLATGTESVQLRGEATDALREFVGRRVVATGAVKNAGVFDVSSFVPVRESTLELVVMSQCPYGVKAADAVLAFLKKQHESISAPKLELRYLFYKKQEPNPAGLGAVSWWCLHGESELNENLVQIAIRDRVPHKCFAYVEHRIKDQTGDWRAVAGTAGLTSDEINLVSGLITTDRETMIAKEYEYVSQTLGISDGSPTYIWESQRVQDLRKVPAFKDFDPSAGGSCVAGSH